MSTRSSVPVECAETATASTPTTVSPVTSTARPSASPATSASRRVRRASSRSAARTRGELLLLAAVDDELGGAAQELDQLGRQLPARRGLATTRGAAEPRSERRDGDAADEEAGREKRSRQGQDDRGGDDAGGADGERDERRPDPAQVEPLQRIDVADHAADEVAAPEVVELRRCERLDARVETAADAPERAQREIVRGEPVEVAGDRPCEPEEADEDDRDRQREDRRMLGRA